MNEIEKLYKNAGIEKVIKHECTYDYGVTCPNDNKPCEGCGYYADTEPQYPDFTAEKQIELIKFLLDKYCDIRFRKNLEGDYYIKSFNDISCFSEDFEETLASFTNTHLQDLTEGEKQQIKEILE